MGQTKYLLLIEKYIHANVRLHCARLMFFVVGEFLKLLHLHVHLGHPWDITGFRSGPV